MKKSIILYLNNDQIFTFPIAHYLIKHLSRKYNFSIKISNSSFTKKIKIILIILLDGSYKKLYFFYKNKITIDKLLSFKNVKKIHNEKNKIYSFGLSINYPKKIINKKTNIYNYHFGNFQNQRGTFIFFYKKFFEWNSINLTFHKINDQFDSGRIIYKRTINVQNLKSLDMIALPLFNKDFYLKSISKINKKIKYKNKKRIGSLNKEPSFSAIIFGKFYKYFNGKLFSFLKH